MVTPQHTRTEARERRRKTGKAETSRAEVIAKLLLSVVVENGGACVRLETLDCHFIVPSWHFLPNAAAAFVQ